MDIKTKKKIIDLQIALRVYDKTLSKILNV